MPKAPELESGRAGTRLKVCRTPPPGSVPLPLSSPMWPGTRAAPPSPLLPSPCQWKVWSDTHRTHGCGPRGLIWSLGRRDPGRSAVGGAGGSVPGRVPWASSRGAERGRVWCWRRKLSGSKKSSGDAGTCLLLSALLTRFAKGEWRLRHDTSPPTASVSSSAKWVKCGPCPTGLILLNPQG